MTIWEILEIPATKDKAAIKNAYRKKLSGVNPEDDPKGFMALRTAFEQATAEADVEAPVETGETVAWDVPEDLEMLESMPPEARIARWMSKAENLYQSFYDRIKEEPWRYLLNDDVCQRLDMVNETREVFLVFLMAHTKLPNRIWKLFDQTFSIVEDSGELKEKFSSEFIDYVNNAVTYEGVINYDMFCGPGDGDYDKFIDLYFLAKYNLDYEKYDEARKQLEEMAGLGIEHPYMLVEKSRLMIYDDQYVEACELLEPLAEKYSTSDYLLYFFACALKAADRDGRARETYEQVLSLVPEHYMAKFDLADLLLKNGKYKEAKEAYLALVDINEHDEAVIFKLQEANEHLIPEYERTIEQHPNDLDSILDLGWCLCQNEQYEKCLKMLEDLKVDDAHLYDYTNLRGRILLCMNRFKEALPYLHRWREMIMATVDDGEEKTKKRIRRLGYANYAIAMSYISDEVGDDAKAMQYIEYAIETEKSANQLLSCYYGKADILKRRKKYEMAADICSEILEKEKRFYPALVLRQECFLEMGYGVDAINDYYAATALYPGGERPYEIAAKVFVEVGKYEKAQEVFAKAKENGVDTVELSMLRLHMDRKMAKSKADYRTVIENVLALLKDNKEELKDHEKKSECYYLMAICCCDIYIIYNDEVLDEALGYIDTAIGLNPSDDDALNIKAYIYSKQGKTNEALRIYHNLLENHPDNCYYLFRIAGVYGDCRELKKALSYYRKVAALDDSYPDVYREIGIILRELAGEEHQRSYYRMAVESFNKQLEGGESQYDLIERGRLYLELGMYDKAGADFMRTLELNENNIYAYNAIGDIFRYQRRYVQAVDWYQKGIDHADEENTPILYENIAQCLECMGRYGEVETWYERVMKLYPSRGRVYDKYAGFFVHIRRYDRAGMIYEKGKGLSPAYHKYFTIKIAEMLEKYAPKEALKIYKQLYKENSQDIKACYGIARHYLLFKDKPRKALDYYFEGVRLAQENKDKDNYKDGCFGVGLSYLFMGRRQEAVNYFGQVLNIYKETYPDIYVSASPVGMDANDYYMIGRLFALCGDLNRAHMYFEGMKDGRRCCDYCTTCTCFEYLMGCALIAYFTGNVAEAVRQYQRAGDIAGNDFECMTALRLLGAVE